jgi:stage II sporulation SpoAA-like protein
MQKSIISDALETEFHRKHFNLYWHQLFIEIFMITQLHNVPENMVAFKATGEITEKDFTETVMPAVDTIIKRTGELNYLLVLDTPLSNFTFGAWLKDALMGIRHLTKWHKAAIVSDTNGIRKFTDLFSIIMPGEFKGFEHKDLELAIGWTSERPKQKEE